MNNNTHSCVSARWKELHEKHPEAILLMRHDDYYFMYHEHALKTHDALGLQIENLNGIDIVSFHHYDLDKYLPKLIRSGCRVAICDD